MQIHGFAKMTLLDYPEHVAATIFTGGCNFRCPFCHNKDLVLHPGDVPIIPEEEVLTFLDKRKNLLDGVCITGGEPTLQKDLPDFIEKVRALGLLVKLDTNGYRPDMLKTLLDDHLLDYVAMDIKNSRKKYSMTVSIPDFNLERIDESLALLKASSIAYEGRTTIVKELHTKEDLALIGQWIQDIPAYYLQNYVDSDRVISPGFSPRSINELIAFRAIARKWIPNTNIRGVDIDCE